MPQRNIAHSIALGLLWFSATAASVNAGDHEYSASRPFDERTVAEFRTPWAIAFLPDARMLITEKGGRIFLYSVSGQKVEVAGAPPVADVGQNGLLDVAVAPSFSRDRLIYFTFSEPGDGGTSLALEGARLVVSGPSARLQDLAFIWRQLPKGTGGQPGGIIAFAPDGQHIFLTWGDRMRPQTAQDPDLALGKVLRLNMDGSTPFDNPMTSDGVRAQTWTTGHRNPYGLAFTAEGKLRLPGMGPRRGDELNLLVPGSNYGWPLMSNGDNYDGSPIPRHSLRPQFTPPVLFWNPVIAPSGLTFYNGPLFPAWEGSALIGGLASMALVRVAFDGDGNATETDRWDMGKRVRDVAIAPDGAVWLLEDADPGALVRLTPLHPTN